MNFNLKNDEAGKTRWMAARSLTAHRAGVGYGKNRRPGGGVISHF